MRYPWQLVVPGIMAKLAGQARYAARRGWLLGEPRVWGEFLWHLPQALRQRRSVSLRALKIAAGLNRRRCVDAEEVRRLGDRPWQRGLLANQNTAPASTAALPVVMTKATENAPSH
jgi:hypothetical protein